jgi:hypothetical protein
MVFQKPVELEDYGLTEEDMETPVFATEGQTEVLKLARVGLDSWVENTLEKVRVEIPVGTAGMSDLLRRTVVRAIANKKEFDKDWKYFYVIATFERVDGTTFFRTVIPRTALGIQFRNLRRGKRRNR